MDIEQEINNVPAPPLEEIEADNRRQAVDEMVHKLVGRNNTESRLLFSILYIVDYDEEFCEEIIRGNQKIVTEAIDRGFVNVHLLKAQINAERATKAVMNELLITLKQLNTSKIVIETGEIDTKEWEKSRTNPGSIAQKIL